MSELGSGDAAGLTLPPRPYPGLRPFEKAEWAIFFGRERMADEIIAGLIRRRMIFVHGDSGCGKSSLIRAGVFARLEQGEAGAPWRTESGLPREAPLWNVAAALARLAGDGDDEAAVIPWRRALNGGIEAAETLAELRGERSCPPGCLLIDQFEELFQHARRQGPEEAQLLTQVLIGLHRAPPPGLYVTMTMRSEYLGACARFEGFAELVNESQYLLPRMGHEDLVRAIREPAGMYGGQVSRELAERLIADAGGGQDQLPLIQHGLMRLAEGRRGKRPEDWTLTLAEFPREGGLGGLLSAHADEVAAQVRGGLDPARRDRVVEDLFRALTDVNADNQAIRRPQTVARLAAVVGLEIETLRPVLDAFRVDGVSFLSPYGVRRLGPDDLVDVSHEALIRGWRALADPSDGWLAREFRNGLVWRALLVQADSFDRDPSNVLAPTTTDEREVWLGRRNPAWAERYGGGWDRVARLMTASVAARDQARKAQDDALRREGRAAFLKKGITLLVGLVGLLVTALFYAYAQIQESKMQYESVEITRQKNIELVASLKAAEERSRVLEGDLTKSAAALHAVRDTLAVAASAPASRPTVVATLDKAAQALVVQAGQLSTAATQLSTPARPSTSSGPKLWLYIHIADESQRGNAQQLEAAIEGQSINRIPIAVPGIERVKTYPSRPALRCFDAQECRSLGPALLAQINGRLAVPQVQLEDLSDRYGGSTAVRANHFELWFPPGPIALAPR